MQNKDGDSLMANLCLLLDVVHDLQLMPRLIGLFNFMKNSVGDQS